MFSYFPETVRRTVIKLKPSDREKNSRARPTLRQKLRRRVGSTCKNVPVPPSGRGQHLKTGCWCSTPCSRQCVTCGRGAAHTLASAHLQQFTGAAACLAARHKQTDTETHLTAQTGTQAQKNKNQTQTHTNEQKTNNTSSKQKHQWLKPMAMSIN